MGMRNESKRGIPEGQLNEGKRAIDTDDIVILVRDQCQDVARNGIILDIDVLVLVLVLDHDHGQEIDSVIPDMIDQVEESMSVHLQNLLSAA